MFKGPAGFVDMELLRFLGSFSGSG